MLERSKNHIIGYTFGLVLFFVLLYFGHFLFTAIKYQHHNNYSSFEKYLWILQDSVQKNVDTMFYVGLERESDNLYEYIVDSQSGKKFITICHFKNIVINDFDSIVFSHDSSLLDLKLFPAEKLNLESDVRPEITIKSKFSISSSLKVSLNHQSKVIKSINSNDYKGFFGVINKISIANNRGKDLILFDYRNRTQPSLFLFYKRHGNLFLVLINSDGQIDESIIDILSLKS